MDSPKVVFLRCTAKTHLTYETCYTWDRAFDDVPSPVSKLHFAAVRGRTRLGQRTEALHYVLENMTPVSAPGHRPVFAWLRGPLGEPTALLASVAGPIGLRSLGKSSSRVF